MVLSWYGWPSRDTTFSNAGSHCGIDAPREGFPNRLVLTIPSTRNRHPMGGCLRQRITPFRGALRAWRHRGYSPRPSQRPGRRAASSTAFSSGRTSSRSFAPNRPWSPIREQPHRACFRRDPAAYLMVRIVGSTSSRSKFSPGGLEQPQSLTAVQVGVELPGARRTSGGERDEAAVAADRRLHLAQWAVQAREQGSANSRRGEHHATPTVPGGRRGRRCSGRDLAETGNGAAMAHRVELRWLSFAVPNDPPSA
jgi:hypothetical protein